MNPARLHSLSHPMRRRFVSTATPNTAATTAVPPLPSFDLARVREEILQTWLKEEAKSENGLQLKARYCSFTHDDANRAYQESKANWHWLDRELSSNLAGESGAVYIYRGASAAMNLRSGFGQDAKDFVSEHMENEASHLRLFHAILPSGKYTKLVLIWKMAGWVVGFLPTFFGGAKALYVTVETVETFVEEHYQQQIQPLKKMGTQPELLRVLEHCCEDEVHHKEDAAAKLLGNDESRKFHAWWVNPWSRLIRTGSHIAADIARTI